MPSPTIILTTSLAVAPNAMRTPISVVRWDTEYETTPHKPTAANASASPARAANSSVRKRGCAAASDTT